MLTILQRWIKRLFVWLQSLFQTKQPEQTERPEETERPEQPQEEQIMSSIQIETPFPIFNDIDGQPLENGFIFVGVVNLNPIVNPVATFFDDALTIPAVQPIRTLGGYPINSGTPARFFVGSDYSIQVQNRNGSVIYTSLNGNTFPGSAGNLFENATGDGVETVFAVPFVPSLVYINGVYQNQNTYTLAGGNVTFSEAPPATSTIEFLI